MTTRRSRSNKPYLFTKPRKSSSSAAGRPGPRLPSAQPETEGKRFFWNTPGNWEAWERSVT